MFRIKSNTILSALQENFPLMQPNYPQQILAKASKFDWTLDDIRIEKISRFLR